MTTFWICLLVLVLACGGWWIFLRKPNLAKLAKKDPKKFLKNLTAFRGLSMEDLNVVESLLEKQTLRGGAFLFREGDKGSSLFIVAGGTLKMMKEIDGKRLLLRMATPGDVVGEMALLTGQPRSAAAQASGETTVFKLDRVKFADLKAKSQVLMEQIWRTYSWNTLDNFLRTSEEWTAKPSRAELLAWYEKQMPFSATMGQRLMIPDGAGMLFVVTGRVSVNGIQEAAPKLLQVSFETKLEATKTSRIIWFAPHPGFVAVGAA